MNAWHRRDRRTTRHPATPLVALAAALAAHGCADVTTPTESEAGAMSSTPQHLPAHSGALSAPPPPGLVGATVGEVQLSFWPYTGSDLSGTPSDPIHFLLHGEADAANLRAILLGLDGNRSPWFPDAFPFDCTWQDAVGGIQAGWFEGAWTGSGVQLECGEYGPLRFHLRLFPAGAWTLGAAHFELLIPGTPNHQVLSWPLARELVWVDLLRSGHVIGPIDATLNQVTATPTFREIPAAIYSALDPSLRTLVGGPDLPVSEPVGIPNDGMVRIAEIAGRAPPRAETVRRDFTIEFAQVIPRPLCSTGPLDWVHVSGPVRFSHQVAVTRQGEVSAQTQVTGGLEVTPVDILQGGVPIGPTRSARVTDHFSARTRGGSADVSSRSIRLLTAAGGTGGTEQLRTELRVGPGGIADDDRVERCG